MTFSKPSKSARSPAALRDLQQIEQCLRTNPFQFVIEVDFAANALKRQAPRINRLCRGSFCRFFSACFLNVNALHGSL